MKLGETDQISQKERIVEWLKSYHVKHYEIRKDLTVDVHGSVHLAFMDLEEIYVQFNEVYGTFYTQGNKLSSFKGFPKKIEYDCHVEQNNLTNFVGAPKHIGGSFFCTANRFTNLHNIYKDIKYIGDIFAGGTQRNGKIPTHVLGLLMIDGLKMVMLEEKLNDILNKYLQFDRDIHRCQEELYDKGLSEFAKL